MEKDEPMFSYAYKYTMHRILQQNVAVGILLHLFHFSGMYTWYIYDNLQYVIRHISFLSCTCSF